ncbi:MAG: cache and HAMP domain-containing protein [Candidatus Riflebacteria bacterium]|nr:cache and HAMP domain-containing protein [Candidatus Riflebacteria bacterium]
MKLPFNKIRHQTLAVVAMAALLPVVLLALFVVGRLRTELTYQALHAQKSLAEAVRQGIQMQIKTWIHQLEHFVETPAIQTMNAATQKPVLFKFLDQNPLFASAFVYNSDGTIINVAYRNRNKGDDNLLGANLSQLGLKEAGQPSTWGYTILAFHDVMKTGELKISAHISSFNQKAQLMVFLPIKAFDDSSRIVGILSIALHLDGVILQEMIEGFASGRRGFLILTDRIGSIIARKGQDLPPGLEKATLSRPPEIGFESIWSKLDGQEYLVTLGPVNSINGYILVAAPSEAVLGFIGKILWGMGLLTIISLVISGGFGLVLANTVIEPIQRLIEGISKVSEGDVAHRIEVPDEAEDELSDAGRAFNEMAGSLEKNRLIGDIWSGTWKPPS